MEQMYISVSKETRTAVTFNGYRDGDPSVWNVKNGRGMVAKACIISYLWGSIFGRDS